MSRTLPPCACVLALASALLAADPPKKEAAPARTTIALTVSAMAEPRPALRYTLLPELKDMNPGNPVQGYLKCFMEQHHFFFDKTSYQNRDKWLAMPLKDLPLDQLRDYGKGALRQADRAARLDTPDWQILLELKRQGIELLLPDVQQMRSLAATLKVRFRAEVAEKRFDAAIHTAQTLFALARHLGEHPTIIGDLVGISIANVATGMLEEMLQQPGCPNLYWALTDLPRPFIDLRKGMQGERAILEREFALFDSKRPLDAGELAQMLKRLDYLFKVTHMEEGLSASLPPDAEWILVAEKARPETPGEVLRGLANDSHRIGAARKRVVSMGLPEEKAKALPAMQILLLDAKNAYEERRDDEMKWVNVPWPKAEAAASKRRKPEGALGFLVTPTQKVVRSRARLDQRIALLRHVEAIRLYAAAHGGKPPASLADIDVPLPDDPFTGKPFPYRIRDKKATIIATPPRGETNPGFSPRYELTIR